MKGSVNGNRPHRVKVRVQMEGDVTGCHTPISVNDDVTALTPAEKHIHTDVSYPHTDLHKYKLTSIQGHK